MQQHMLRIVRNCELCDYPYCDSLFLYLIETFNTHTPHLHLYGFFIYLLNEGHAECFYCHCDL